ncbi:MAG: beta-ribofuranosylaminobenzene 5'-phosphate synthase family protein [Halobacteriota archaeon]
MERVSAPGRLHFGFGNLSLSKSRLYGAVGVAIDGPETTIVARRGDSIRCSDPTVEAHARRVCDFLDLPGAVLTVERRLPEHVGLGSGTQLALATLQAIASCYDRSVDVRAHAPALGRGGRSGVGVAAFERGGFVLDGGHPTARFTTDRPADGEWTVPTVTVHQSVPDHWRFLLVIADGPDGRSGEAEDASMRSVVERADPTVADRIAGLLVRRVLPAIADGRAEAFGDAIAEIGRLNGAWYADEQGGVYRPPVGAIVDTIEACPAVYGAGQSSWGPAVYGVTDDRNADEAVTAGRAALDEAGVDGDVRLVEGRNSGARVESR